MKKKQNKLDLLSFAKGGIILGESKIWILIDGKTNQKGYPEEVQPFDNVINIVCERSGLEIATDEKDVQE